MLIATLLLAFAGASAAQTSEDKAYAFLDSAMDQFASAPALRLPSSYHRESIDAWDNSVLYDDALVIIAYARDTRSSRAASLVRARNMGDALLRAQSLDPAKDGRLRNAYGPENLWSGGVNIQTWGSATGNLAWAGIALAHLSDVTKDGKYTDGATRLGQWIINNARDTRGAGGYTGSLDSNGGKVNYKSTEHNIDLLALFNLLSTLTGQAKWATAAAHARTFVDSMWNASRWEIGTLNDGVTLNAGDYIPEDVTDGAVTGARFALQREPALKYKNDNTVWLEGTAHMALALKCARRTIPANTYLASIRAAQSSGPDANGTGIPANSKVGWAGGDDQTHTSLHTGATAWHVMAAQGIDPFTLGGRCSGDAGW